MGAESRRAGAGRSSPGSVFSASQAAAREMDDEHLLFELGREGYFDSGARRGSVGNDWLAVLPEEKAAVFYTAVRRLDKSYVMMSVALDDAIRMRGDGRLPMARLQAGVCADLLGGVEERLLRTVDVLLAHCRHLSVSQHLLPQVAPLRPEYFRHPQGRRFAAQHSIAHYLFWTVPSRFFLKLRALRHAVTKLARRFEFAAREIADGTSVVPQDCWRELDELHFDLNTCLQEVILLFKSALRLLPVECLPALRHDLRGRAAFSMA
jgi:hypothetical protein